MNFNYLNKLEVIKITFLILTLVVISNPTQVSGSNLRDKKLNERLFNAVHNNNLALVTSIISAGANIKATNDDGLTPAGLAVEKGYFNIAHYILGIKNQKNQKTRYKNKVFSQKKNNEGNLPAEMIIQKEKSVEILKHREKEQIFLDKAPKIYKKWPNTEPNPFSPNAPPKMAIPIIGVIQESPNKSPISSPGTIVRMKELNSNNAPLKTGKLELIKKTSSPTPIQPLDKKVIVKTSNKKESKVIEKIKGANKEEELADESMNKTALEEAIDRVWAKIKQNF